MASHIFKLPKGNLHHQGEAICYSLDQQPFTCKAHRMKREPKELNLFSYHIEFWKIWHDLLIDKIKYLYQITKFKLSYFRYFHKI